MRRKMAEESGKRADYLRRIDSDEWIGTENRVQCGMIVVGFCSRFCVQRDWLQPGF